MSEQSNPFEGFEVISQYTDSDACEDGTIVAITAKDRTTRNVWDILQRRAPAGSRPPNCWPVDLMGWFTAAKISKIEAAKMIAKEGAERGQALYEELIAGRKALALARGLIGQHAAAANRTYEQNIDGGIYKVYAVTGGNGELASLEKELPAGLSYDIFWLVPNENGGITLMLPEDY
jgi:hypothetical protein